FGGAGYEFTGDGYFKMPDDPDSVFHTKRAFWEVAWGGAEVEVDTETGAIHLRRLVVSSDVGHALMELACRGQDEGAAVMALGQTLFEQMVYDGTQLATPDPLRYR